MSNAERCQRYREKNLEKEQERSRQYYEANREEILEQKRRWHQENREKKQEYNRRWAEKNRQNRQEYNRRLYLKDPERRKASTRRWVQENRGARLDILRRRRARKENAGGEFTAKEFTELCKAYGNVCLCCGEEKKLTADHVIPLSKGGSNDISNIQPLCQSCNSSKYTKTTDYRPLLDKDIEEWGETG